MKKYDSVVLYSGGTDSTVAPILAMEELGNKPLLLMINIGESVNNLKRAKQRANILGLDFKLINCVKEFAKEYVAEAIHMNASYWGYPLITPLSRACMVKAAFTFLEKTENKRFIIHGCTRYQNTRTRIEKHCAALDNSVKAYGPLANKNYSREDKLKILNLKNIETDSGSNIAEDQNIWGRALEGDLLNEENFNDNIFQRVKRVEETPEKSKYFSLTFERGIPTKMDGKSLSLDQIIIECNKLGAKYGVGRIVIFEDTIPELGYKERGVFESPASVIIYAAHGYIQGTVLSKTEREIKRNIEQQWSDIVYRGGWYDSNRAQLSAFIEPMEEKVSGTVTLKLFKGHVLINEAHIPNSILLKPGARKGAY